MDLVDYSVAKDDTVRVEGAETLGHYAEWLGVSASRLRQLNQLKPGAPVLLGRTLKLDLSRTTPGEFEAQRRAYHLGLQANFFEEHRILGTEIYLARRGDSLWSISQRYASVPIWLLQQYNPDMDLADIRPGTPLVVPRVEALASSNGTLAG
jgi:membrane-bound lytic murein transglycosylase D